MLFNNIPDPTHKVRVAYSARVLHAPNNFYGKFTRGAENIIRDNFKDVRMSAVMLDHKKRMISTYAQNHEAFFLFGAAADIADAEKSGLHKEVIKRIKFETELTKQCIKSGKLLVGACGGFQSVMKFLFGVRMDSYIPDIKHGGTVDHYGKAKYEAAHLAIVTDEHSVNAKASKQMGLWNEEENRGTLPINSIHKQGIPVKEIKRLQRQINNFFEGNAPFSVHLSSHSSDGYVEGIEIREKGTEIPMIILNQFHPEYRRFHHRETDFMPSDAEKSGKIIYDEFRNTIVQSRLRMPQAETRQALIDFIDHKKQLGSGIESVPEKAYEMGYDQYKANQFGITQ